VWFRLGCCGCSVPLMLGVIVVVVVLLLT